MAHGMGPMTSCSFCTRSAISTNGTWSSVRRPAQTADWRALAGRRSSCTAPDAVCTTTAAAAAESDADAAAEQTRFAECSRCPEERCRKTCL